MNDRPLRMALHDDYLDEVEIRIQLARVIERKCRELDLNEGYFTSVLWSAIMVAPLESVQSIHDLLLSSNLGVAVSAIESLSAKLSLLFKICTSFPLLAYV